MTFLHGFLSSLRLNKTVNFQCERDEEVSRTASALESETKENAQRRISIISTFIFYTILQFCITKYFQCNKKMFFSSTELKLTTPIILSARRVGSFHRLDVGEDEVGGKCERPIMIKVYGGESLWGFNQHRMRRERNFECRFSRQRIIG